jgi:hypothetical protein
MPKKNACKPFLMTVIVLCLSLAGCAQPPVLGVAVACPPPVPAPEMSTQLPLQTYSDSAAKSLSKWRERLTATPPMH